MAAKKKPELSVSPGEIKKGQMRRMNNAMTRLGNAVHECVAQLELSVYMTREDKPGERIPFPPLAAFKESYGDLMREITSIMHPPVADSDNAPKPSPDEGEVKERV